MADTQEICRNFRNKGSCRFDTECRYEHSEGEPIVAPEREIKARGVCFNWTEHGECKFENRCRFFHGTEEEAEVDAEARRTKAANKAANGGNDNNYNGGDGEGKTKKKRRRRKKVLGKDADGNDICRNWMNKQECKFGDDCNFSHNFDPEDFAGQQSEQQNNEPRKKSVGLCFSWRDSQECEYGDDCRFKHGEDDNRDFAALKANKPKGLCYNFRDNGECQYADQCRFSHEADAEDDR